MGNRGLGNGNGRGNRSPLLVSVCGGKRGSDPGTVTNTARREPNTARCGFPAASRGFTTGAPEFVTTLRRSSTGIPELAMARRGLTGTAPPAAWLVQSLAHLVEPPPRSPPPGAAAGGAREQRDRAGDARGGRRLVGHQGLLSTSRSAADGETASVAARMRTSGAGNGRPPDARPATRPTSDQTCRPWSDVRAERADPALERAHPVLFHGPAAAASDPAPPEGGGLPPLQRHGGGARSVPPRGGLATLQTTSGGGALRDASSVVALACPSRLAVSNASLRRTVNKTGSTASEKMVNQPFACGYNSSSEACALVGRLVPHSLHPPPPPRWGNRGSPWHSLGFSE